MNRTLLVDEDPILPPAPAGTRMSPPSGAALRRRLPVHVVEQLCLQARRMRSIPRLGTACRGDAEQLFAELCAEAPALLGADGVAILLDDGEGAMRVRAAVGFGDAFVRWAALPTAQMVALTGCDGEAAILPGGSAGWPGGDGQAAQAGMASAMWAPIRCGGRVAGGLLVGRHAGGLAFDHDARLYAEVLAEYVGARMNELRLQQTVTRLQASVRRATRLALVGELAWAFAREAHPPLTAICDRAERTLGQLAPGSPLRPHQETIHRESRRVGAMMDALLDFGGRDTDARSRTHVSELIDTVLNLVGWQLARDEVNVEVSWDEQLPPTVCCPHQIEEVLVHLIARARASLNCRWPAGGDGKVLRIDGRPGRIGALPCAEIEVWDAGMGVPARRLARLFDPPGSEESGDGIGLGLAVCRDVLREHDGCLHVESEEGAYTRVVLSLPLERA
jgi:signal transduction histidine kinase